MKKTEKNENVFITKAQAAKIMCICIRKLDMMRNDGDLAYYKFGRSIRLRLCDLLEYAESHRVNRRGVSGMTTDPTEEG